MIPKNRFFELAKKLSLKSDHHSHKLGCVIVRRNKIVSIGFNKLSTHTRSNHPYKSLHAEISALIGVSANELAKCAVYVYRQTRDGKPALAKPCASCDSALRLAGVKGVFYTSINDKGWEYEQY